MLRKPSRTQHRAMPLGLSQVVMLSINQMLNQPQGLHIVHTSAQALTAIRNPSLHRLSVSNQPTTTHVTRVKDSRDSNKVTTASTAVIAKVHRERNTDWPSRHNERASTQLVSEPFFFCRG
ncbi:hypothetical protein P606_13440 [Comamonas thiooxydans]|nr:hypothetical protein P606_13440 [Comamonas thiooxydans]